MVKKVFYIEKAIFLRSMMELALKAKGAEIYTVDTLENNDYLFADLTPDLIIFDVLTCKDHLHLLLNHKTEAKLVAVGEPEDEELIKELNLPFMPKPFVANNFANRVLGLLD